MISIYLIVAIICAILLAITAAFADFGGDMDAGAGMDLDMDTDVDAGFGHGDFHGAGISPLSIPVVLVFGTLFGATGTVFEALEYNMYVVPIIAVIVATVVSAIVYVFLVRVFVKTQATTRVDMQALLGREGETTMPIKVGSSGQILVITEERGRTLLPAVSDADIPTNTVVEIISVVGNGVKVRQKK
jgi:membrane protein implicated in regulation of membrane protease activity